MADKKRTKTVELLPSPIFLAEEDDAVEGDLEIYMYEDGSILFVGASILEHEQFTELLSKIQKYLTELKGKVSKKEK